MTGGHDFTSAASIVWIIYWNQYKLQLHWTFFVGDQQHICLSSNGVNPPIIIIIKNELIIVTLHTKVLQGHFTQINAKKTMSQNFHYFSIPRPRSFFFYFCHVRGNHQVHSCLCSLASSIPAENGSTFVN